MTAIVLFVFAATLVYLVMNAVIYYSLSKLDKRLNDSDEQLKFSILIAAKNEAANLPLLFKSLTSLNYPKDKFEIIMIDDNSSDNTFELGKSFENECDVYSIVKTENHSTLSGKKAALAAGINIAKFDHIAITDADCEVPSAWLKEISRHFTNNDIVIGVAPLKQTKSFVNKIAAFENLKTHQLVFAFANIGQPYSGAARNLSFKKSLLHSIGGYESLNETIGGDDDLLLREAIKRNIKIGIMSDKASFVYSHTKTTFAEYLKQKGRHISTSHHYLLKHKLMLGLWHLSNLICLFSFLLSPISSIFVLPIIIKLLVDYLITNSFQNKFGYIFSPIELAYLSVINEILIVVNFINSFRFKKRWN